MGDGGGQILRTCLALSLVTGKPFKIVRVRARRKRPGLRRQHLASVEAAAAISAAQVAGSEEGSEALEFWPTAVRAGHYRFDIGTAGSTTLVLQSVLPSLILADAPSTLHLTGGTHNPLAPTHDFLTRAFLPLLGHMGARVEVVLGRPGYYPKGGGEMTAIIRPTSRLRCIEVNERGEIRARRARATVAGLPRRIAERELRVVGELLGLESSCLHVREELDAVGPGNVMFIEIESDNITEVFTGFGERGVRAETVAARAARAAQRYLEAGVAVGEYLGDQLLLPMALAGGGSFTTLQPTLHARTNGDVIRKFIAVDIEMNQESENSWRVTVSD